MKNFIPPLIFFIALIFSRDMLSQVTNYVPFPGDTAGIVNGRVLTRNEYIDIFNRISGRDTGVKPRSLTEDELLDTHRKTWTDLVVNAIVEDSIEKKGITVTDAEARMSLEKDPPEFLKHQFIDSAGTFQKQDYMQALHDPRNDTILRTLIKTMKVEMRKQKFSEILLARVPQVTDDELWEDYRKQENKSLRKATRKKFEEEKEKLYAEKLNAKQQAFMSNWIESAKATAKIIDYRTIK